MMYQYFTFILLLIAFKDSEAKVGFGPGEQDWGYVSVRPNATTFWWLYYTTADVKSFYEKPLVIWLDGGPGGASSFIGNFELIGPLDTKLKPREHNWVKKYNVLFIDSPVGVGFSHVDDESAFALTNKQTADDLLACIKKVFQKDPNLKRVRSYVVGESYGAKLAIEFARVWYDAEKAGDIQSRLSGVALGAPWISPKDSVESRTPYLFQTGLIDDQEYKTVEKSANLTIDAIEKGNWMNATLLLVKTQDIFINLSQVDMGNILYNVSSDKKKSEEEESAKYESYKLLMNSKIKPKLNLTTVFDAQSLRVTETHYPEIMKPVTDQVEYVLNNSNLKVYVYNGQLDLIVPTSGTLQWVNNLRWRNRNKWQSTVRKPLIINDIVQGYVKKYGNFAMYWLRRSGHRAPYDNPAAALEIMDNLTARNDCKH